MKFLLQLINYFIKIDKKNLKNIENKLNLSGIEVDNIENHSKDVVINLSVTANRKEINSAFGLARELSIILNQQTFIKPIYFRPIIKISCYNKEYKRIIFDYIRIHIIKTDQYNLTPSWILDTLKLHEIKKQNTIKNIQEYIKLKWGKTFYIVEYEEEKEILIPTHLNKHKEFIVSTIKNTKFFIRNSKLNQKLIIIFMDEKDVKICKQERYKNYDFDENYYIDSLTLIKSFMSQTIGKFYEYYSSYDMFDGKIQLRQNKINKILGKTQEKAIKYIKKEAITIILNKLKFHNEYIKNKKLFLVEIPQHRKHDIAREIDIIEEISRIYEFKNFYGQYNNKSEKRKISRNYEKLKKIRKTLQNLGFKEVVNCSLTNNNSKGIKIHNPLNEDQKYLRNDIKEKLIKNHEYNLKYSNEDLFIFEIGTAFKSGIKFEEKRLITGLIYAKEYNRNNWEEKAKNISHFQAKGIIETFLKKIEANITIKNIEDNKETRNIQKSINKAEIYDKEKEMKIGIIEKLYYQDELKSRNKEKQVYIFEIDLDKLIKSIKNKKHLEYIKEPYSSYPSIVRDISLKVKQDTYINKVIETIYKNKSTLVESIKIFNEYNKIGTKKSGNERFIGIRIVYRSLYKTLSNNDINEIDQNINLIINKTNNI